MLWLLALAIGLVAGLLTGGSITNFARLRFRWPMLVIAAVVVREAVLLTPLNRVDGAQYVYALSLAAIVVWTIPHFKQLPGIWLVTIGGGLNLVVILANGGRMPVAAGLAGRLAQLGHSGQYTLMGSSTQLNTLGDWISFGPIPEVYSPGDVVIALGLAVVAFLGTRPRKGQTRAAYSGPNLP
jgi:hypothetical protein